MSKRILILLSYSLLLAACATTSSVDRRVSSQAHSLQIEDSVPVVGSHWHEELELITFTYSKGRSSQFEKLPKKCNDHGRGSFVIREIGEQISLVSYDTSYSSDPSEFPQTCRNYSYFFVSNDHLLALKTIASEKQEYSLEEKESLQREFLRRKNTRSK